MQTRREFVESSVVLLLMVPVVACGSTAPPAPGAACNGTSSTSTVNAGHSHTLCVPATDLSSPPSGGATYSSSANGVGPHTHTVTLTQAELGSIEAGQSVTVTSSNSVGHTHDFAIVKM